MATQDPLGSEPEADKETVRFDGFDKIFGAGGYEPAAGAGAAG